MSLKAKSLIGKIALSSFALFTTSCLATSSSASWSSVIPYEDTLDVNYRGTQYTSFLGFLTDFLGKTNDLDWPSVLSNGTSHYPFFASEDITLNGESIFYQHTFYSTIEDPYHPGTNVPFYERYQTEYPNMAPGEFYLFRVGSPQEVISVNDMTFDVWNFSFFSPIDEAGVTKSQYEGYSGFWYNSLIENIATSVANPSIINPENAPLLSNFVITQQGDEGFQVSLDIRSWRLGYFSYNFSASLLENQTDFNSTITINFDARFYEDKLTITIDPGTQYRLPFSDNYLPTATDEVLVTLTYQLNGVDWQSLPHIKTLTAEEMTPLLYQAYLSGMSSGTFLL